MGLGRGVLDLLLISGPPSGKFAIRYVQAHQTGQNQEPWFLHMHKRALTLDAFSGTPAVLDFWIGPRRRYWIWRAFLGQVAFQALFSGFEELDARDAMRRLVRVTPDSNLADWHDREHRAYMRHLSG